MKKSIKKLFVEQPLALPSPGLLKRMNVIYLQVGLLASKEMWAITSWFVSKYTNALCI